MVRKPVDPLAGSSWRTGVRGCDTYNRGWWLVAGGSWLVARGQLILPAHRPLPT